jgi:predicted O-methyltransferase YrrM
MSVKITLGVHFANRSSVALMRTIRFHVIFSTDQSGEFTMSDGASITALRRTAKRIVRSERFRGFSAPARRTWYYWRTVDELKNAPFVLSALSADMRQRTPADLIDLIFTRFDGMLRPFQNKHEFKRFIERVAAIKPQTVVEIGTARGGSLFLLSCVSDPNALLVSIDLPAGQYGGGYPSWKAFIFRRFVGRAQTLHLIRGDSHKQATFDRTVNALKDSPVDLLFIDGDHSYDGAKKDFLRYRTLVRPGGLIVFHDILESKIDNDVTVAPLWQEIARNFPTEEIVDSYDQGQFGIGILTAPQHWEDRKVTFP